MGGGERVMEEEDEGVGERGKDGGKGEREVGEGEVGEEGYMGLLYDRD